MATSSTADDTAGRASSSDDSAPLAHTDAHADPQDDAESGVVVVDAIGRACPLPVIDLASAVKAAEVGTVFHLLADDGAARVDVPIWCRMQRQRLDDVADLGSHARFVVTKVSPST